MRRTRKGDVMLARAQQRAGKDSGAGSDVETELRAAVARKVGDAKFGLWFGEGVRLGVDGDALEVAVPNGFFREWIRGHFSGSLVEAAESVVGRPLRLTFKVDDEAHPRAEARPELGRVIGGDRPDEARPAPAV